MPNSPLLTLSWLSSSRHFGLVLSHFVGLRARRVERECSTPNALVMTSQDVEEYLLRVKAIVYMAGGLLPELEAFSQGSLSLH